MSSLPEPIYTRVGHTGAHELRFQGKRVFGELLGTTTTTQMFALAITGRLISTAEATLIDDMMTAMASADPRLWPFKLTRLASAHGSASYGVGATIVASQGAIFGPTRFVEISEALIELAAHATSDDEIEARLRQGRAGFGILYGRHDARFDALMAQLARRGHQGAYTSLVQRTVDLARARLNVEPHVFVAIAALGLDLRMTARQIGALGMLPLVLDALPNAVEGAQQAPIALQCLSPSVVQYVGPRPRASERAQRQPT
ncbi:MAG: hypothetical protein ABI467_01515 [Kofleriaceae bacterium]